MHFVSRTVLVVKTMKIVGGLVAVEVDDGGNDSVAKIHDNCTRNRL